MLPFLVGYYSVEDSSYCCNGLATGMFFEELKKSLCYLKLGEFIFSLIFSEYLSNASGIYYSG